VISVVRFEFYRMMTVRSALLSIVTVTALGLPLGFVDWQMWALLIGVTAFTQAAIGTSSHFHHRTAVLLYLGQPRRVTVLVGQTMAYAFISALIAALSGVALLTGPSAVTYPATVVSAPAMAILGVTFATLVRRAVWTLIGAVSWFVVVEGLIGKLRAPLPFTVYLDGTEGDGSKILYFFMWALCGLIVAIAATGRDITVD